MLVEMCRVVIVIGSDDVCPRCVMYVVVVDVAVVFVMWCCC